MCSWKPSTRTCSRVEQSGTRLTLGRQPYLITEIALPQMATGVLRRVWSYCRLGRTIMKSCFRRSVSDPPLRAYLLKAVTILMQMPHAHLEGAVLAEVGLSPIQCANVARYRTARQLSRLTLIRCLPPLLRLAPDGTYQRRKALAQASAPQPANTRTWMHVQGVAVTATEVQVEKAMPVLVKRDSWCVSHDHNVEGLGHPFKSALQAVCFHLPSAGWYHRHLRTSWADLWMCGLSFATLPSKNGVLLWYVLPPVRSLELARQLCWMRYIVRSCGTSAGHVSLPDSVLGLEMPQAVRGSARSDKLFKRLSIPCRNSFAPVLAMERHEGMAVLQAAPGPRRLLLDAR
mmetsp:Transcript_52528/g.122940  ORF Transcript_52528/g.122940 Transcript_52528/m.122940 type:complete len:345 (-) Transcript_52528:688-1722(-)